MIRLRLALAAWAILVPSVPASLSARKEIPARAAEPRLTADAVLPPETFGPVTGREPKPDFVVTDQTEIRVDGRPCRFNEVPVNASIFRMELAADKKTVLTIQFRTRK
jgi:hypothetical protein